MQSGNFSGLFYGSWGYDKDGDILCNDTKSGYLVALPIDVKDSSSRPGIREGPELVSGAELEISITSDGESVKCFKNGKELRVGMQLVLPPTDHYERRTNSHLAADEKGGAGWSGYFKFGKIYPCVSLGRGARATFKMTIKSVPEPT